MYKLYQIILLCYAVLIVFVLIDSSDANSDNYRVKRYLSFRNVSKFFYRLNFKANMVPWTQIFAQAVGFRMNWDDPPDSFHPYHHLQRRTVYSNLETLMDRILLQGAHRPRNTHERRNIRPKHVGLYLTQTNGLNGYQCVRRAICEVQSIQQPAGLYHKILKMVFRKSTTNHRWHNVSVGDCQHSLSMCPFSLLEVSPYTDL